MVGPPGKTVLVLATDGDFAHFVGEVLRNLPEFRLTISRVFDAEFANSLADPNLGMVLLNLKPGNEAIADAVLTNSDVKTRRVPVVIANDYCEPNQVLHWLLQGAADCLSAPHSESRLRYLIESLTLSRRMATTASVGEEMPFCCISDSMMRVLANIRRLADQRVNVLLTGETGVGKTRIAQLMHDISSRNQHPFVSINCGSIPETLFESELFGHKKGSFTGAVSDQLGAFGEAKAGTLLLDEVDALSLTCQSKLLHAVDLGGYQPVGGRRQKLKASLVFASNRPLEELVREGEFRADLYYRICGVDVHVPPLRERQDDILAITNQLFRDHAEQMGTPPKILSPNAKAAFVTYAWKGNIRELRNVVGRLLAFSTSDVIELEELPHKMLVAEPTTSAPAPETQQFEPAPRRDDFEAQRIKQTLERCRNNRTHAARELGISRSAFYKKLVKYQLVGYAP